MQHVIITGGAGFIGSHLCDAFLEQKYAVTAIDNFISGQKENLKHLLSHPNFQFIESDICNPLKISEFAHVKKYGLHGVLHFACPASPIDFDKIPIEILKVDSIGTMNTVEWALQYQARYLLASTSEVYGDPLIHPQTEDYWGNVNPTGPRACYDETKRFAEAFVSSSQRSKNLNAGIVRIFNTYGPRMRLQDGRIIPEFCRQVLSHQPITIHGEGTQTRSYCYILDLVQGILQAFHSKVVVPVNLGNPDERTVSEVACLLKQISKSSSAIQSISARVDDPKKRKPDITRAQTLLNWNPSLPLEEGLKITLDYFKKSL